MRIKYLRNVQSGDSCFDCEDPNLRHELVVVARKGLQVKVFDMYDRVERWLSCLIKVFVEVKK